MKSIRDVFKGAVSGAAEWVGGAIGGAIGGSKGAAIGKELGGALGARIKSYGGGGGEFTPISTEVGMQSYGGKMPTFGFKRPGEVVAPRVVDADTLNKMWEARLTTYMANAAKFDRTTEVSKLIRSLKA